MNRHLFGREKAILFALPFVAIAFWPVAASHIVPLPKLAGVIVLAVIFLLFSKAPGLSKPWTSGDILLCSFAAFVGATLLRVAISPVPQLELWGLASRLNGAMLYLVLGVVLWAGRDKAMRDAPWMPIYALVVAGLLTGGYAVLQVFGHDVISWNTPGVVSSLGNADHTASFHALVTMAGLWTATDKSRPRVWRAAAAVSGATGLVMVCYWAQREVVQGLLLVGLFLVALMAAEVVRRGHRMALAVVLGALAVFLIPLVYLAARVDRGVMDRLYMFAGGIRLWLAHPMVGVGMSRVQDFYNQFRLLGELAQFGTERSLDDLHSVPIQVFAMTGLLGGLPYLLFTVIATVFSAKILLSSKEDPRSVDRILAGISLAWMAQTTFSPDSATLGLAGMSSFGVLTGRRLLGESAAQLAPAPGRGWRGLRWASAAALVLLLAYRVSIDLRFAATDSRLSRANPTTSQLRASIVNDQATYDLIAAVKRYPSDPSLHTRVALTLGRNGYDDDAMGMLLDVVAHNPNDYQATNLLSRHYQSLKAIKESRRYVNRLTTLVPFNPDFWIQRADLALVANDTADAKMALDSARSLALKIPFPARDFWSSLRRLRQVRDSLTRPYAR